MATPAKTPAPPLRIFALCIGGPIDFTISGSINAAVAWWVFLAANRVELLGWHSILMVTGPMFFILPLATTLAGYLSGVTQRRQGKFSPEWVEGTRWVKQAWRIALTRAVVICPLGCGAIVLAHILLGDVTIEKLNFVIGNGLLAGTLGYALHSTAILQAEKL